MKDVMATLQVTAPAGAAAAFHVFIQAAGRLRLRVSEDGAPPHEYQLGGEDHGAYIELFDKISADFALRRPLARQAPEAAQVHHPKLIPLLTEPLSASILYGYGDPCVVQVAKNDFRLLVTSNDAPDAFPILTSADLSNWRHTGFVFPAGATPPWAITGPEVGDFWAPELHRLGAEWVVCFTARIHDRSLAIGLARSPSPDGPFVPDASPIVRGGVIDAHILVDAAGAAWLIWKQDENDRWPRALARLLHGRPDLASLLFDGQDLRTATFALTLWPWVETLDPMRQFFVLQTLVEAVGENLEGFTQRLLEARSRLAIGAAADEVLTSLRTRLFAQRLSQDGRALEADPSVILQNDQPWEGHLIEGVWVSYEAGRYYLLYAGNDFSTHRYAIGTAVGDAPTGPYRKQPEVFLTSSQDWQGPGHPCIATGPDGRRHMFFHAFRPGEAGYKAFRALLTAPIALQDGLVSFD